MADVSKTLAEFGPLLLAEKFGELAARYDLPCVVEMFDRHVTLETAGEVEDMLRGYGARVKAANVTKITSTVMYQGRNEDDTAFARVQMDYADAVGTLINRAQTQYLMRFDGTRWRIGVLTLGQGTGGICRSFLGADTVT